jgi:hypothetical protein
VSQDDEQNRASSDDVDPEFPTVEQILASARKEHSCSSNATDMSDRRLIDTDTCLPGSNVTYFDIVQFGTNEGKYSKVFRQ